MKKYLKAHPNAAWIILSVILSVLIIPLVSFEPVRIWKETEEDRERMSMTQVMWVDLSKQTEGEYFAGTTTLVRAELVSHEGFFCYDAPTNEWELGSRSVFTFRVKEVLYDNAPVRSIKAGRTYRMYNDFYMTGSPYDTNYTQYRGYVGEEVLILLDGNPYTTGENGNPVWNAKAYQQDYVDRMGYRIVDPKWGVIPIVQNELVLDAYLPPCLRRSEKWKSEDLVEYITAQVKR